MRKMEESVKTIAFDRTLYHNSKGALHRLDGPAVEFLTGDKEWWVNGLLHRIGAPAIEYADGGTVWWENGQIHRLDGPAIEYATGTKEWWVNGNRHRIGAPAIEYANGEKHWYKDGKLYSKTFPKEVSKKVDKVDKVAIVCCSSERIKRQIELD
jgi:hypothetical protein